MINKHDNSCDLSVHQIPNVLMIHGAFASDRIRFGRERKDRGHALPPQRLHNVLPVQIPAQNTRNHVSTNPKFQTPTRPLYVYTFFHVILQKERSKYLHGVLDGFAGSFSGEELVDGHLLVLVLLV